MKIQDLKKIIIFVAGVYVVYLFMYVSSCADWGAFDSFSGFITMFVPILLDVVLFIGCYGVCCLLEEVKEIKEGMLFLGNNIKKMGNEENSRNTSYYPSNNTYNNIQKPVYNENEPVSTGWVCSCGFENARNSRFCTNCGKSQS